MLIQIAKYPYLKEVYSCSQGIIFIKVNPIFKDVIDVKKVANKVCKDVRENLIPVSRFCFKAVPIQVATKASLETFQENIKSILDQKFKPGNPKKVFDNPLFSLSL